MKIDFDGNAAYVFICPICKDRHIGADPAKDQSTHNFMERHAKWHTDHPHSTASPNQFIVLGGEVKGLLGGNK